MTYIVSGGALN